MPLVLALGVRVTNTADSLHYVVRIQRDHSGYDSAQTLEWCWSPKVTVAYWRPMMQTAVPVFIRMRKMVSAVPVWSP